MGLGHVGARLWATTLEGYIYIYRFKRYDYKDLFFGGYGRTMNNLQKYRQNVDLC